MIILILAATTGTAVIGLMASERHGERESDEHREWGRHRTDAGGAAYLRDPAYALYQQGCGDCHMAYPPPLLPAASWNGIMNALDDHFGDNAELDAASAAKIADYLERYGAGNVRSKYGDRTARASLGMTPARITETDYFVGQHHEIPRKMVEDNAGIMRFSHCEACHTRAADGSFDEHQVRIPGYGRWDD